MKSIRTRRRVKNVSRRRLFETLETRCLFSVDLMDLKVEPSTNSTPVVAEAPLVGALPFLRAGILGSGIASVAGTMPAIAAIQNASEVTFVASEGTTTSFVISPTATSAILSARILRADGSVALGPVVASSAGESIAIPSASFTNGTYRLAVTSTVVTGVNLSAARNAVIESQIGDATPSNELRMDGSFQDFGGSGVLGAVGSSRGGYALSKVSNSTSFIDISTRGNLLPLSDDQEASVVTTVGNSLFRAGDVTISNNGAIVAARSFNLPYANTDISNADSFAPVGLYPFWDDIDGRTGGVYWIEESVAGIPTLIVQWENRPRFSGIGNGTFQLQLYASGPVLARFVYEDVVFGDTNFNFGQSATIGVVGPNARSQFSFNQASIANNDSIEIRGITDVDEYEFRGAAGQSVDIALDVLGGNALDGTVVELYRGNTLLATAVSNPIDSDLTVANYDLGISGYTLSQSGIYSVRVSARSPFDYYLAVTKNAPLDTENSNENPFPTRSIDRVPGAMMGYLDSADERDVAFIRVNAGRSVRFVLSRIGDDAGYRPVNNLVPRLSIIQPDLSIGASTAAFNENGEIVVDFAATQSGRHRIAVNHIAGRGEYVVRALQPSIAGAPMVESMTALGALSGQANATSPFEFLSDINGDGEISPIDALLVVNQLNQQAMKRSSLSAAVPQVDEETEASDMYFDINSDGMLSPLDALLVINRLNKRR